VPFVLCLDGVDHSPYNFFFMFLFSCLRTHISSSFLYFITIISRCSDRSRVIGQRSPLCFLAFDHELDFGLKPFELSTYTFRPHSERQLFLQRPKWFFYLSYSTRSLVSVIGFNHSNSLLDFQRSVGGYLQKVLRYQSQYINVGITVLGIRFLYLALIRSCCIYKNQTL